MRILLNIEVNVITLDACLFQTGASPLFKQSANKKNNRSRLHKIPLAH